MENGYSEIIVTVKTRKIDLNKRLDKFEEDKVALEAPVRFFLNEKLLTTIMALPSNLKEMALGFLIDEGVIPCQEDILDITVNNKEVYIQSKNVNQERCTSISKNGVILTSCSSRVDYYRVIGDLTSKPLTDNYHVDAENVLKMVKESIKQSTIFQFTGGVHSASIFVEGTLKGFAEDVGRHNAVDKVIGTCLLNEIPLEKTILITSGRQTSDTVIKAARCRIPISVSMRAPLSSGIYTAELAGITLICFARGRRMNIYSHPERVKPIKMFYNTDTS
jgi:FdhD protein